MKKIFLKAFAKFVVDEKGSITMEWIGIAAVAFIAAISISAFILEGADGLGVAVTGQMDNAALQITGTEEGG